MSSLTRKPLIILCAGLLLSALLLSACSFTANQAQQEPLLEAFNIIQAQDKMMHLAGWTLSEEKYLTLPELTKKTEKIAKNLDLEIINQRQDYSDSWCQASLTGTKQQAQYEIICQSLPGQTYLIINIETSGQISAFPGLRYDMQQQLGENADYTYLIMGTLEGKYRLDKLEKLFSQAMKAAGAQKTTVVNSENYICYSGYAEGLAPAVSYQEHQVNLQIISDYNKEQNLTYVYLGIPLVFSDY
ncbi:MAG: YwmB family TATA-box binding protein [Bacillota bacterium]|jgi:hypothetical protein